MLIYDDNSPGEILIVNKSILPLHKNRNNGLDKEFINNFKYIKKKLKRLVINLMNHLQMK